MTDSDNERDRWRPQGESHKVIAQQWIQRMRDEHLNDKTKKTPKAHAS